jgi:hypothetical protein
MRNKHLALQTTPRLEFEIKLTRHGGNKLKDGAQGQYQD